MSDQDKATLPFGPVQLLVLGFERVQFDGEIMPELERLKDADIIRLIDMIFVTNNRDNSFRATLEQKRPRTSARSSGP